jgi:drug/metabolite transporter (DMT)-like permease
MWIALALTAGTVQAARNALARSLAGKVSPALNSWARFTFNLPFLTPLLLVLLATRPALELSWVFLGYCAATGLSQLLGSVALGAAFERANFAESILLHKLEIVFAALIGFALFDERPTPLGWAGVATCACGILLMNLGRDRGPRGWLRMFHLDTGALLALGCGLLLVFASFFLKEATREVAALNPHLGSSRFEAAVHTLFHTTWIEVLVLSVSIRLTRPGEFAKVPRHWRRMLLVGLTGFVGSLCWFWAYSIAIVAYVKAVGQIESVFAIALGIMVWGEREIWQQLPGVLLVLAGIGLVLFG